jgi:hypothetical protein
MRTTSMETLASIQWWRRGSKYAKKGDSVNELCTMNGKKFVEMVKQELVNDIMDKVGWWADGVVVQMDGAGGHAVKKSVDELNKYCKDLSEETGCIPVTFMVQPARSPDLNVLDLGCWASLQAAVPAVKYEKDPTKKMYNRIIDNVYKGWNEWVEQHKIEKVFKTLREVWKEVQKDKGGNRPHYSKETRRGVRCLTALMEQMGVNDDA